MHLLIDIVAEEEVQAKVIKTSIKVMTSDQNKGLSDQTDGYSSFYDYLVLNYFFLKKEQGFVET